MAHEAPVHSLSEGMLAVRHEEVRAGDGELELVVDTDANVLPVYDSTDIHCRAAADWILG